MTQTLLLSFLFVFKMVNFSVSSDGTSKRFQSACNLIKMAKLGYLAARLLE